LYCYIVLLSCIGILYCYIVLLSCIVSLYWYFVLLYCIVILYWYFVLVFWDAFITHGWKTLTVKLCQCVWLQQII